MPEIDHPGVYVEETSFRARSIEGVPTSGTAFVLPGPDADSLADARANAPGGAASRDRVVTARDYADFARMMPGATSATSMVGRLFFENGGADLHVLRASSGEPLTPQLAALDAVPGLGLLCLPGEYDQVRLKEALVYAERRGLFLLVDPPRGDPDAAIALSKALAETGSANAAVFFPSLLVGGVPVPPSAAVAGLYARTDRTRGVWKPPAGVEATLLGVDGPSAALSDPQDERLSDGAVNAIRTFPDGRTVVWGARTVQGVDAAASDWKYVNVRRLFIFLERSIDRGTQWAVFEPNDEPLWATIRQQVGDFLHSLWKAGAFAGQRPQEAFFVKCDRTTMSQNDLDNGRLVLVVGFAPLRPSEFVTIRIEQRMTVAVETTTVTMSGPDLGPALRLPHRPVLADGFRLEVDAGEGWIEWAKADDLGLFGPGDREYSLDQEAGEVRFGDGVHGASLPSGVSNVRATYRSGGGEAGDVPANDDTGWLRRLAVTLLRLLGRGGRVGTP